MYVRCTESMKNGIYIIGEEQLESCALVIRKSFATVAHEFGVTEEN